MKMRSKALRIFVASSLLWLNAGTLFALATASAPATGAGGAAATGAGGQAAAKYKPLVPIPGLEGVEISIGTYLGGLFNFLLSIVGIVAVVMLVIGGMKYITAAGSGGAVTGAKETIKDAIFGLLLALLSAVILDTINPDVRYLRDPGYQLQQQKDQNITGSKDWVVDETGTYAYQEDGTILYTDPKGITVLLEGDGNTTAQQLAEMYQSGREITYTEKMLVGAMERQVSCIAAGSPSGVDDPNYHGKCVCVVGNREIILDGETVKAGGGCNEECEKKGLCGYKFLSVKINARHGYDKDGQPTKPGGAGSSDPIPVAGDGNAGGGSAANEEEQPPEYTLTSDTAIHADELWEMHPTNDPKWGDFDIQFQKDEKTGKEKKYFFDVLGARLMPCALLVTNEEEFASDEHFVYWVPLGTVVGGNEHGSLFYDLNGNYNGGCNGGEGGTAVGTYGQFRIQYGTCEQEWTDRVMLAKYSDDIVDKCKYCNFADQGSIGKAYRWVRPLTCRGGYWQ